MNNYLKTTLLLGILSMLLVWVGGMLGGQQGIMMGLLMAGVMNVGSYWFSDKLALMSSGAKPVTKQQMPDLYAMVDELTSVMKLPMPSLYVIPTPQANAFATGRDPQHAAVAVTEGILKTLQRDELKGVIAHELAHIQNRDILIATIAATIAGGLSALAHMGMYTGGARDEEGNSHAGMGILAIIVAPIAASLLQMAISREREFEADEAGAKAMGNGDALARALIKIHQSTNQHPQDANPAYASLYIANPMGMLGGLTKLFSTHPPVEERIERLRAIKQHTRTI